MGIFDDAWNEVEAVFGLIIFFVLLIFVSVVVAMIWFLIAAAIAQYRYRQFRKQAEADFEKEAQAAGINYNVDDVINAIHGAGIQLPNDGYGNVADWVAGTFFGVEDVEEVA